MLREHSEAVVEFGRACIPYTIVEFISRECRTACMERLISFTLIVKSLEIKNTRGDE